MSSDAGVVASDMGCGTRVEETGLEMILTHRFERWPLVVAALHGHATARGEGAARRQLRQVGRLALDRNQALARVAVEARDRGHQALGVGMLRALIEDARRRALD